jgi:hypothetical protein
MFASHEEAENGYSAVPIVEGGERGEWKAGVLLSVDEPRGVFTARSFSSSIFSSREAALEFAQSEFGGLAHPAALSGGAGFGSASPAHPGAS